MRRTALFRQLVARKSIDKLIRDSQEPGHSLKKSLGPWSLTALGIGAVIGSGIFTVIGTAMAGQNSMCRISGIPRCCTPHPPHGHGRTARRGTGACPFAGAGGHCLRLHRALLRRTGVNDSHRRSAYTYTYATLGELVAWIIGWDLILEYAFST